MTAYVTGTATNAADLWSKLLDFLQNNTALAAANQTWSRVWTGTSNDVVLRGPGMAGQDQVYVGLQRVDRPTPDEYEIRINGMTGILQGANGIKGHVNAGQQPVRIFLDSNPFTYWFIANGRRFIVILKITTVFQAAYAGLFLPYANPAQYGYPLFVGGSAGSALSGDNITSWRSAENGHRHFPNANVQNFPAQESSAWFMSPQGEWLRAASTGETIANAIAPRRFIPQGLDQVETSAGGRYGSTSMLERMRGGFGGEMLLTPHTLVANSPANQTWGILDGTYHVAGYGNGAENIVTVGGVDHLVVQDCFRTGALDYWAVALA